MTEHVDGAIEPYVLGMLEPAERDAVDAHLATCAACSQRVGEAERVSALLDCVTWNPPRAMRPPGARFAWLGAAAALVLSASLGTAYITESHRAAAISTADDVAFTAIANGHFLHAAFVPIVPSAPIAKVLYARDGSWVYIVVAAATARTSVVAIDRTGTHDLGSTQPRGTTATLFARRSERTTVLRLRGSSGDVVSQVSLPYPSERP